jgi:hypothetical protein
MKKWAEDGSDYDIYKDGLKYTTIDSRMQLHAEKKAVSAYMAERIFNQSKDNKTLLLSTFPL